MNSKIFIDASYEPIKAFTNFFSIPVTFFNLQGDIEFEYNKEKKVCSYLNIYNQDHSKCKKYLLNAFTTSSYSDEPYFFSCDCGLLNIVVPHFRENKKIGYFVAGPITPNKYNDRNIQRLFTNIFAKASVDTSQSKSDILSFTQILKMFKDTKIFTFTELHDISIIFNGLSRFATNPTNEAKIYNKSNLINQNYIEFLNNHKSMSTIHYPYDIEEKLLSTYFVMDYNTLTNYFNQYLEKMILYESGDIEKVKIHLIEFFTILSKSNPTLTTTFWGSNQQTIKELQKISDFINLQQFIDSYIKESTNKDLRIAKTIKSDIIIETLKLLSTNEGLTLSLENVSKQLHVNASYLSTLFKKELKMTYSDYVINMRVNKAKHLLKTTSEPLIDICYKCGFKSQSYFAKVFKYVVNISPSQYRRDN